MHLVPGGLKEDDSLRVLYPDTHPIPPEIVGAVVIGKLWPANTAKSLDEVQITSCLTQVLLEPALGIFKAHPLPDPLGNVH